MIPFGYILLFSGIIISVFGEIQFLVIAYRRSALWFLGCLIIPFVALIFFLFNFQATAKPVGLQILGLIIAGIGGLMAGIVLRPD
jgi:hypothetical protein